MKSRILHQNNQLFYMGNGNGKAKDKKPLKEISTADSSPIGTISPRRKRPSYRVMTSTRTSLSPKGKSQVVLGFKYPNVDNATIWMMSEKIYSAVAYLTPKGRLYIIFQTRQDTIRAEVRIESGYCEVILRSNFPSTKEIFKTSPSVKPQNPLFVRDIVDRSRTFNLANFSNYQSFYNYVLGEDFPEITNQLFCWTWSTQ